MTSVYMSIDEHKGEPFQTEPLSRAIRKDAGNLDRLAAVAAIIRTHFCTARCWEFRVHSGSLTLQNRRARHQLVKIFVDQDNRLAAKTGLFAGHQAVVAGVELTEEEPFVRECLRDRLADMFGDAYLDPRKPRRDSLAIVRNDKYWISPHSSHYCDMVCIADVADLRERLPVDPAAVARFAARISAGLGIPAVASLM